MRRVRQLGVDAGPAALLALADAVGAAAGTTGVGWLWFAAIHLPLVVRRRFPVTVFWTVFAIALAAWTVAGIDAFYPFAVLLAAVATLARHRTWRWWWPAVAAVAAVLATGWSQHGLRLGDLAALAAALTAAVLLGITVRTRRAYVAEVERRAAAAERTRIAREVHDIVAHNLAVMIALADGAALTAAAAPRRAADTLGTISATGREALEEMRRLLGLLRDSSERAEPGPQPGLGDLDQLVAQVREAGLETTLVREGTPGRWGPGAELTIYRLVQEALTNTLKHAGPAATARITLRYTEDGAELEIINGGGSARAGRPAAVLRAGQTAGPRAGRGLAGMLERVAAYHGRVDAGPLPTGGWRVYASLHFGSGGEPS
ncbi:sensor histidine kinase [Actinoplanes sp. CA-030573]|uniref:sensor histidine kinase n=1 Tax=Actinoplanes sp. CA-030573 TaxID=3239898 RepID=UPI003D8FEC24